MNAYYDANCLTRQEYIKGGEAKLTVMDVVNKRAKEIGKPLTLSHFIRWSVGQS